jgi:hypothetical protein
MNTDLVIALLTEDCTLPDKVGEGTNTLHLVNSGDSGWTRHTYVLAFGAYGWTRLFVWANNLQHALDEAIDWLVENAPGHIVDDQLQEDYEAFLADGLSEEEAQEKAEEDTTCGGNCGNRILSHEWSILAEDPTAEDLRAILGAR